VRGLEIRLKAFKEIRNENSEEDLFELCKQFDLNILGLTVARDYMMTSKITG
jgi:hypothetical protein